MRRRPFLALATGALVSVAGCNTSDEGTPTDGGTPSTTTDPGTPTTTDEPSPPDTETPTPDPNPLLDVQLQEVPYVARAYEVPEGLGVDPDHVVPEHEIPRALVNPLRSARYGEYETDDVSEDLLAAVDEFRTRRRTAIRPYVELDGRNYEFDARVPTFAARLGDDHVDDADPDRVAPSDGDYESEAVSTFVRALAVGGTHVPREEYRICVVPDAVETFLERYDYVEDHQGVSPIETEWVDEEPPHAISARELTDEDMWGRPVLDGDTLDGEVREFLWTVVESDHRAPATYPDRSEYFTDHVPDAYLDLVASEDHPYFRLDGTVYGVAAGSPTYDLPVAVAATALPSDEDDPGRRFRLSVTPTTEGMADEVDESRGVTMTSNGALPSVLWVTHGGERHLLESDAYDRSRWYDLENDGRGPRPVNEVLEVLDFGETIAATYVVPDLPAGTYTSRGWFTISWSAPEQTPGERGFYPFRLAVTVHEE